MAGNKLGSIGRNVTNEQIVVVIEIIWDQAAIERFEGHKSAIGANSRDGRSADWRTDPVGASIDEFGVSGLCIAQIKVVRPGNIIGNESASTAHESHKATRIVD